MTRPHSKQERNVPGDAKRKAYAARIVRYYGRCECGGNTLGTREFGRMFTWCSKCTPILKVKLPRPSRRLDNEA